MLHLRITLRVLYGGSVKASNAAELFGMADVRWGPRRRRLVEGGRIRKDLRRRSLSGRG
jgi:hypothetical protein